MGAYAQLARLPPPRPAPVEVEAWVRRVAALETRLEVRVGDGPPVVVTADGDQLDQLLINLVRNAADAALETGGGVRIGWRADGGVVEVTVDDEGPGLPDPATCSFPSSPPRPTAPGSGSCSAGRSPRRTAAPWCSSRAGTPGAPAPAFDSRSDR